ncbi:hypothetical protein M752DRAFT_271359 [Aspergillus phoenicis ATCC 13157]|uniref:Uncharacterized protein n=1 Tax=Aspergillus phoenicis ATCC 13157 TaxID=1353007 RepID=A0A370P4N1_ASPPH|nr:hypothetical protein M752DRAFT_271359 [Aspergillus phoenicis ATCC 13157]
MYGIAAVLVVDKHRTLFATREWKPPGKTTDSTDPLLSQPRHELTNGLNGMQHCLSSVAPRTTGWLAGWAFHITDGCILVRRYCPVYSTWKIDHGASYMESIPIVYQKSSATTSVEQLRKCEELATCASSSPRLYACLLPFLAQHDLAQVVLVSNDCPALTITAREQFIPRTLARTVTGFLQPKDSYIAVVLTQRQRNESMERLGKGPLRWAAIRSSTISTSGLTAPGRTQSEQ